MYALDDRNRQSEHRRWDDSDRVRGLQLVWHCTDYLLSSDDCLVMLRGIPQHTILVAAGFELDQMCKQTAIRMKKAFNFPEN